MGNTHFLTLTKSLAKHAEIYGYKIIQYNMCFLMAKPIVGEQFYSFPFFSETFFRLNPNTLNKHICYVISHNFQSRHDLTDYPVLLEKTKLFSDFLKQILAFFLLSLLFTHRINFSHLYPTLYTTNIFFYHSVPTILNFPHLFKDAFPKSA